MENRIHLLTKAYELNVEARKLTRYAPSWRHREVDEIQQRRLRGIAAELERIHEAGEQDIPVVEYNRIAGEHAELAAGWRECAELRWRIADLQRESERLDKLRHELLTR